MQSTRTGTAVAMHDPPYAPGERWPTDEDLPSSDGMPMKTHRHVLQMVLLITPLDDYWHDRDDVFVGGDMFVYYSINQDKNEDYRGPDFFAVQGVPRRSRKSWVTWDEGKPPDVVVELLSPSTAAFDRAAKKQIYQDRLKVPE